MVVSKGRTRSTGRRFAICLALLAFAAPAAQASTASVGGETLSIAGGPESSDIGVYLDCNEFVEPRCSGNLAILDKAGITPGANCTARSATEVLCPASGVSLSAVTLGGGDDKFYDYVGLGDSVSGGDGNDDLGGGNGRDVLNGDAGDDTIADFGDDALAGQPAGVTADGGPGNDDIDGSTADDLLRGGDGNDDLTGLAGDDELEGGDGDDELDDAVLGSGANAGSDDLSGGEGFDSTSYSNRGDPVTVTMDDVANDGIAGENDNVRNDVDKATGGTGDDALTGGDGDDTLWGNSGDDEIRGGGGDDTLEGSSGNDEINGGAGDDGVKGQGDDDTLVGGPGRDSVDGDDSQRSSGSDTIKVRDGERDRVTCLGGGDVVEADQLDVVDQLECEEVDRSGANTNFKTALRKVPKALGMRTFLRRGLDFKATVADDGRYSFLLVVSRRNARRYGFGREQLAIGGFAQRLDAGAYNVEILAARSFRRKLARLRRARGFRFLPATVVIAQGRKVRAVRATRLTR